MRGLPSDVTTAANAADVAVEGDTRKMLAVALLLIRSAGVGQVRKEAGAAVDNADAALVYALNRAGWPVADPPIVPE
jgi:hypothetical protein